MFSANVFDAKTLELAEKWTSPQPPRERLLAVLPVAGDASYERI